MRRICTSRTHLVEHFLDGLVLVAPRQVGAHHLAQHGAVCGAPMRYGTHDDVAVSHQADELLAVTDRDDAGVDLFHELSCLGQRVVGRKGAHPAGHGL
jgi:hypothetical protein